MDHYGNIRSLNHICISVISIQIDNIFLVFKKDNVMHTEMRCYICWSGNRKLYINISGNIHENWLVRNMNICRYRHMFSTSSPILYRLYINDLTSQSASQLNQPIYLFAWLYYKLPLVASSYSMFFPHFCTKLPCSKITNWRKYTIYNIAAFIIMVETNTSLKRDCKRK